MTTRVGQALLFLFVSGYGVFAVVGAQPPQTTGAPYAEYVVQFEGPILESWKTQLTEAGAEILQYIPDFSFKVRMQRSDATRISRLPGVVSVRPADPAEKFARGLLRGGTRGYIVSLERGADPAAVEAAIAATGSRVVRRDRSHVLVVADPAQLDAIALIAGVRGIDNMLFYQKHNEYGGGVIAGAALAHAAGFDGSTQAIAVADTGVGHGTPAGAHVDLPAGRVASIFNWPGAPATCFDAIVDDGAADVDSGHGTHVVTTALGGGRPDGLGRGTAPAARLIFQSIENWARVSPLCTILLGITDGYYLVGIPSDIGDLFEQSHAAGARVQSISWGSEASGAYTTASANADAFVWGRRDMTIAMSAGNSGVDSNGDGIVDGASITSPATAKNVITVGASESDRQSHWDCDTALAYTTCAAQGGQNALFTYGAGFADRYPSNPLRDDPSGGDGQQMAAFSSRGPTADGRIKPDVVAPGTWILSGYSDRFQQQYDPLPNPQNGQYQYDGWGHPFNAAYKYMGGTSMSAPLVAGGAAVVRDYYAKAQQHQASAALVKATIINAAVDLLDENNDGVADNAFPIPNMHEGWGRIDLEKATGGSQQFVDEDTPLVTGERATFTLAVAANATPLKITVVWTDYPSTESAARALVNDLDLKVTGPDGTIYLGNAFSGGWSAVNGSPDRVNNVENVYVESPASGTWSVSIRGFNVPMGPQPFALVVDGASGPIGAAEISPAPPVVSVTAADSTATEAGPSTGAFRIVRSGDTTAALTVRYSVGGTATSGSDYTALSVEAVIPAGSGEVTLPVEPLDDEAFEADETVVLALSGDLAYDIGEPLSATVTIVSDDQKPDLVVTAVTAPAAAGAGDTVTVTNTVKNQGVGVAPPSAAGFYLSANTSFDASDTYLGSRAVSRLVSGAVETHSTALRIPDSTPGGSYYVVVKADWDNTLAESSETNNTRASAVIKVGPDLVVSTMIAPASAGAGDAVVVEDTTKNQGAGTSAGSVTAFYLSTNTSVDATDVPLGQRPVTELQPGATAVASTTLTIPPSTVGGVYYIIGKADSDASVSEAVESNNVKASSSIRIGADLTVTAVSGPVNAGAGSTITVTDTTSNSGAGEAPPSATGFYLSLDGTLNATDQLLTQRAVPALASGGVHTADTPVTIPSATLPGKYYVIAKADAVSGLTEANESNNTRARAINVGPDLTVTSVVAPVAGGAGKSMTITDTIKNVGVDAAAATTAAVYLSANISIDSSDVLLASHPVDPLAGDATRSTSVSVVIPAATATGSYYILVNADHGSAVAEFTESNNVGRSGVVRIGPDLTVSALSAPSTAVAGATVQVTDTTANTGSGDAPASTASFYLSTNSSLDAADTLLATRDVPPLTAGLTHGGSTSVTLPSTLAAATYYIIAKADGPGVLTETFENNTRFVSVKITVP